ncbi:MAG: ABC transporter permease [Caldilineales bacterium]|nr:ABC transporter permease [Caldilineales bacterium]
MASETEIQTFNKRNRQQVVIKPQKGWQPIDLVELREYRDLYYFLVLRDVQVLYKQTVLGFAWAILRPFLSMIVFTVIFGRLAGVSSDGVPYSVFSYVALVPWTYYSSTVTASTTSLIANSNMLTKVYFPRLVFPLTPVAAKLVDFAIAFMFIPILMILFGIAPTWNIIYLPLLILLMIIATAGAGLWLSALAVQYRDINYATQFLMQLLMYAAPVVWPLSSLREKFSEGVVLLYGLYPMAGIIEGFRSALLGTVPMPWGLIAVGSISAIVTFISGAYYYRRMEAAFADVA